MMIQVDAYSSVARSLHQGTLIIEYNTCGIFGFEDYLVIYFSIQCIN